MGASYGRKKEDEMQSKQREADEKLERWLIRQDSAEDEEGNYSQAEPTEELQLAPRTEKV